MYEWVDGQMDVYGACVKTQQLFIIYRISLATHYAFQIFLRPFQEPFKCYTQGPSATGVSTCQLYQADCRAFIHSVNTGFKWVTLPCKEMLCYFRQKRRARQQRTRLASHTGVRQWNTEYRPQTECRSDRMKTLLTQTIAGVGKRGIQRRLQCHCGGDVTMSKYSQVHLQMWLSVGLNIPTLWWFHIYEEVQLIHGN